MSRDKKQEIKLNNYTKQKIAHQKYCDEMVAKGFKIIEEPGSFSTAKFGEIKCTFRYWFRINPDTNQEEKIPYIGFI
jgi:hypothetical protein